MNLNLIPNIESHQKYIDYFEQTANTPAGSDDHILIEGQVTTQEPFKKEPKKPPGAVQLIEPPPEVQVERAKEELKRKGKRATPAPSTGPPTTTKSSAGDCNSGDDSATCEKPSKRGRKSGKSSGKKANPYVFPDIFTG